MNAIYKDNNIFVGIKPAGVNSTDVPGGMPELVREYLGDSRADVRTVHRLDQVVSGVMVLARSADDASELSRQIRENIFGKTYLAVVYGCPEPRYGKMKDLLFRDKSRRMTMVVDKPGKDVQEAELDYLVLKTNGAFSLVQIKLITGRTHQIRCQFSSRGMPIVGDRKYGYDDGCDIALWSHELSFVHPATRRKMSFKANPPKIYPWTEL